MSEKSFVLLFIYAKTCGACMYFKSQIRNNPDQPLIPYIQEHYPTVTPIEVTIPDMGVSVFDDRVEVDTHGADVELPTSLDSGIVQYWPWIVLLDAPSFYNGELKIVSAYKANVVNGIPTPVSSSSGGSNDFMTFITWLGPATKRESLFNQARMGGIMKNRVVGRAPSPKYGSSGDQIKTSSKSVRK